MVAIDRSWTHVEDLLSYLHTVLQQDDSRHLTLDCGQFCLLPSEPIHLLKNGEVLRRFVPRVPFLGILIGDIIV